MTLVANVGNFRYFTEGIADPRVDAVVMEQLLDLVGYSLKKTQRAPTNSSVELADWQSVESVELCRLKAECV